MARAEHSMWTGVDMKFCGGDNVGPYDVVPYLLSSSVWRTNDRLIILVNYFVMSLRAFGEARRAVQKLYPN